MSRFNNGPYSSVAVMKPQQLRSFVPTCGPVAVTVQPSDSSRFKLQPQAPEDGSTMLTCSSLDQWRSSAADRYQGLRVARPIDPTRWQSVTNQLSDIHGEGMMESVHAQVIDLDGSTGEDSLRQQFEDAANAISHGLEPELAQLVSQDAQALASTTQKLVPQAEQIIMKLELFDTNSCFRWHQDWYVCRAIVSYNLSAMDYTADSNVDFHELYNRGTNDAITHDKSRIRAANVGDMVLIKGKKYPGTGKSLVHKSPEISYDCNGRVQTRLILKVDVLNLRNDEKAQDEKCKDEDCKDC
mmetsp:Transcript_6805/g.12068  ORF Transcript_6805/g.12068 Transcript_6805/m.12068 type:complete len:298 (+) Transcript_6805:49-942(+)